MVEKSSIDVVISDLRIGGDSTGGLDVLRRAYESGTATRSFLMSAYHFGSNEAPPPGVTLFDKFTDRVETMVSDVASAIEALISQNEGADEEEPSLVTFKDFDVAVYKALVEHPELMDTLDWRFFEGLLADVLETFDFEVDLMQGTKDGGIDVFAIRRSLQMGDELYILQAKRWKNKVGVEPVRELLFLQNQHLATKSCLATTSTFTRGAWDLSDQYRWQLELKDHEGILDWLKTAYQIKQQRPPSDGRSNC